MRCNNILSSFNFRVSSLKKFLFLTTRNYLLFFIIAGLIFPIGASFADNRHRSQVRQNIHGEELTVSLDGLLSQYQKASSFKKEQLLSELEDVAAQRKQILLSLMEDNPGEVLRLALPERVRAGMPDPVKAMLEKRITMEGDLEVLCEDYDDGTHRMRYFVKSGKDKFSLYFKGDPPEILSGVHARVNGIALEDSIVADSDNAGLEILALDDATYGGSTTTSPAALPNTFEEQRTAVFLVNFQNKTDEPYTIEEARSLVFGEVSDYFSENSFGRTWLSGDVFGWYTAPFDQPTDSSDCKTSNISKAAKEAAQNDGVDLSSYDRYIYVFPQTSCFPTGIATVGGSPSEAWINGNWFKLKTVGHELGHNLGLFHSAALECGETTLGDNCNVYPYGDTMDIMGNKSVGHFNAFQKERLGWLSPGLNTIITADVDGAYSLEAYETAGGWAPKAVKVLKDVDAVTGEKSWYYLEYRQALGFDDFLAGNTNVLNGLVFRSAIENDPRSSLLLDMTPASSSSWDWGDPALVFGNTYSDVESGVSITSLSGDGDIAVVDIRYGEPACSRANPSVTISPSESPWEPAGAMVSYTLKVTNKDSLSCAGSSFDLMAAVPQDWIADYGVDAVYLEPGDAVSTTLEITSSPFASDGFYEFEAKAQDSGNPEISASVSATYVVSTPEFNNPPVAVDDSAATVQETSVVIDVLANDWDPDNDPLTIIHVTQGKLGTVSITDAGKFLVYTPNPKAKGTDGFLYTITDGNHHVSASVLVSIEKSTASKGKGVVK
jgi:hypothetical protein